jgi:long-chain acyl-CoA synthetase
MGVAILEGYGLTETSPLVSVNRPDWIKFGTVGPLVIDVEVKIAADGEILVRGPNIMQGYYNMPEKTAEVIEADGWFHTGDIGEFDEDGFLKITDRKKDLLVLANGKKVAPQPIETLLKESPYISQVVLFGDKQSIVTALVVPLFEHVKGWVKERGMSVSSIKKKELAQLAAVKNLIQEEIERLSGHLANFERIHRFSLIDHEFTVESGEMTPTFKVKRRVVMEKYRDVIETMYRG